jgi:hypothetical protein
LEIECLVEPPDIGLEEFTGTVSGAIRKEHDILGQGNTSFEEKARFEPIQAIIW